MTNTAFKKEAQTGEKKLQAVLSYVTAPDEEQLAGIRSYIRKR